MQKIKQQEVAFEQKGKMSEERINALTELGGVLREIHDELVSEGYVFKDGTFKSVRVERTSQSPEQTNRQHRVVLSRSVSAPNTWLSELSRYADRIAASTDELAELMKMLNCQSHSLQADRDLDGTIPPLGSKLSRRYGESHDHQRERGEEAEDHPDCLDTVA